MERYIVRIPKIGTHIDCNTSGRIYVDGFVKGIKDGQMFIQVKPDGTFGNQIVKVIKSGDEIRDIQVVWGYDITVMPVNLRYDYKPLTRKILNDYIVGARRIVKAEYLETVHKIDSLMSIFKN